MVLVILRDHAPVRIIVKYPHTLSTSMLHCRVLVMVHGEASPFNGCHDVIRCVFDERGEQESVNGALAHGNYDETIENRFLPSLPD